MSRYFSFKPYVSNDVLTRTILMSVEPESHDPLMNFHPKVFIDWVGVSIHTKIHKQRCSFTSRKGHYRNADIDLRIGTPQLDNTHPLRDAGWLNEPTHFTHHYLSKIILNRFK